RVGWFDAVAARYTAALAGADALAVMLLDVLSGLDEVRICTAYEVDGTGEKLDHFPGGALLVEEGRPGYEAVPGVGAGAAGAARRCRAGGRSWTGRESRRTCRRRRGGTSTG